MSLHIYPEMDQRSEEWFAARRGLVTASMVGQLITPSTLKPANNDTSRGLVATLAAERITGFTEPSYMNADMERGVLHEPFARDVYSQHHGTVETCGFMVREFDGYRIGFSPDGLVGESGLIEVKCPRAKGHLATIIANKVPSQYVAQCQTALLVSGREWIDFLSFHSGLPLWRKRVEPDEKWFTAIKTAVAETEEAITQMVADYEAGVVGLPPTERIDLYEDVVI